MDNFIERSGYDEFYEMEEGMEENTRENWELENIDTYLETKMDAVLENIPDHHVMENHAEEAGRGFMEYNREALPEKDIGLEPVREPVPENPAEGFQPATEVPEKHPMDWTDERDEIVEEDLPVSPFLKPIDKKEELYKEIGIFNDEEKDAYWDYIHQSMAKEHEILKVIPMQEKTDRWPPIETPESLSFPFSSMDYQREHPFNRYHWRLEKIYEKVKGLGIDYSTASDEEGKDSILQRYKNLVDDEFKDKADFVLETYRTYPQLMDKNKVFARLADLHSKISKCKDIWNKYSSWE